MPINWFPGHMSSARRDIRKGMSGVNLVIEVLDARIPFSGTNPLVAELRGDKPCIQVLNKSDLADPGVTAAWLADIAKDPLRRAVSHSLDEKPLLPTLLRLSRDMVREDPVRPMIAMIVGIPNVGKSTLINSLSNRKIAKVANNPAITRSQQRVKVNRRLVLLDTPGFLWPRLSPEACGYRLAVTGAISDRVVDPEDIAVFAAAFLRERYPDAVRRAYDLDALPDGDVAMIEAIGRKRGCLIKGGVVDLTRASERLLRDLRAGVLGRISLETPADFA